METLLKYNEADLGIYSKEDIRKADKYRPVYKRLNGDSIVALSKAANWQAGDLKRLSEELTHVNHG